MTHGKYAIKTINRAGMDLVWRPYLLYPGQTCIACKEEIKPHGEPAIWGGRDSGHFMEFHHARCFSGDYVVNARDRFAHDSWKASKNDRTG